MSLRKRYVVCYNGHQVEATRYVFKIFAWARARGLNAIPSTSLSRFSVHPESDIDANSVCPHGRPGQPDSASSRIFAALAERRTGNNPDLEAFLSEVRRGEERRRNFPGLELRRNQ